MGREEWKGQRYICLVRASDPGQGPTSTKAQLEMLNARAAELGMSFVDQVVLEGVTGSLPGRRTDLTALLERKKSANDFDVLVLQRIDRLTRSGSGHGFWFEHECHCAGIRLLFVGDDIPEGRYASLIKVAKYEAAQEQAYSISQRSTQGSQLALEQKRNVTSSHTPYACWRLYMTSESTPTHIIRDLRDGRQEKLHPETYALIDTYGQIGGGGKGHYRKQKEEKVLLMPGDSDKAEVVRLIFDLHFLQGLGGKRIADLLNRRGIPSPELKEWSQRQVEVIYEAEIYTGRSVGNRTSSAIYHRRSPNAPQPVELDPMIRNTAPRIPVQQRPREEWFIQEQPLMADFLDEQVRTLAMAEHEKLWKLRGDPTRPRVHKNQHGASEYLLTGLLFAKQDGEPMVGILCGRVGEKVRYYRHKRGRRGYRTRSIFNRMLRADQVEAAVLDVVQQVLADTPQLEERIRQFAIQQASEGAGHTKTLEALKAKRGSLRKRTEFLVSRLDEATLEDAQGELQRLGSERKTLDEQIAAAEAAAKLSTLDPEDTVRRVMGKLADLSVNLKEMPTFRLREALASLVERVEADLETKQVKIQLALPSWVLSGVSEPENAMRLVRNSESSTSYQTHQGISLELEIADCDYIEKRCAMPCVRCRRRKLNAQADDNSLSPCAA